MNLLKEKFLNFNNDFTTISGLNEGEKYFLPSLFSQKIVLVTLDEVSQSNYQKQLTGLGKKVLSLPSCLPLMFSFNENKSKIFKTYYNTLPLLAKGDFDVLLLTPSALFQKLPNKDFILSNTLNLEVGKAFSFEDLQSKLFCLGYVKQDFVSEKGEFSLRGDILDIFPVNKEKPLRISFFDDEIEKINYFNPTSFKPERDVNKLEIFCTTLFDSSKVDVGKLKSDINNDLSKITLSPESMLRITNIMATQLEYLSNNIQSLSSVFFLPFCDYFNGNIFSYLDENCLVFVDEPKLITDKIKAFEDEALANFLDLSLKGEFLPSTISFYLQAKEVLKYLSQPKTIAFSRLISQNKLFDSTNLINFICPSTRNYQNHFVDLVQEIKVYKSNHYTVVLSAVLPLTINKLKSFFEEAKIDYCEVKSLNFLQEGKVNITTQNIPFSCNFEMEKFVIIGSKSLNNFQVIEKNSQQIEDVTPKFLPKVGDYVVHQIHGIGKCEGIQNLKITNVYRDYIIISYKDGDKLYLPCENADMLSAFVGEENPKCNKIGGTEFFKVKQKVKSSIKTMAFDLLKVYSARMNQKGFKYSKDSYLQQDFEASFPYPYTPDQINAIKEIKADMESSKIMDRLLCGDVGFGKTEVALVSAFKAIQDGKQVAIICPTTILCEQHYNTALSRLKNFLVSVEAINRFKTKKEQEQILNNLKDGKIDLICGTHRLLSNDVHFKDLGLVILDEEQRFGVEDKEKLKNIKNTVDVLSLSATPIPRTLYMSLVGIRDVSYLTTPPKERKKINTMVIDYSDNLLVTACKKELDRGGQVLIVYNKVETITNFYAHIKSLLPQATIDFVHGQMPSKTLEQAIYNLYTRKTQILISTVLIENGVDLPYANTMFVVDADKLGLSQLYQLRGRIGRSNVEAYAYFSFSKNKTLTVDSYKRLDAIMEFSDFGSGYKIAMRDLEIRGAGDVLGAMQHGHMQQVGYDMYVKLLNEAVSEIKGESVEEKKEIKLDISQNAYFPSGYMPDSQNRIAFYTQVSKLKSIEELKNMLVDTQNKMGNVPKTVEQLCYVGLIKNLAQSIDVKVVKLNEYECKITFYPDILNTKLYNYLKTSSSNFVLNEQTLPIITLKKQDDVEKSQQELIKFLINCQQIKNN